MKAKDVMTAAVASVGPDTPRSRIAKLLLEKGVSAVPVVDRDGAPIGIVSEGDLIGRNDSEREARRDWWLDLLAQGQPLSPEFLASLGAAERTARELMSAPVVTVDAETDLGEVARLLAAYRIKRVPVLEGGRMVGIVSRADLLRGLAVEAPETAARQQGHSAHGLFDWVDQRFHHNHAAAPAAAGPSPPPPAESGFDAGDFRDLVTDFAQREAKNQDAARRAAADQRRQATKELIDRHISDREWRNLLQQARQAAEHGQKEFLLLRFPASLCSDRGRAVNAPEPDWPATLRGEAAELYLRWERDLKPRGFPLQARVLDFPDGMPGDIGLFISWTV
jgi:CBS domain-containing protein